MFRRIVALTLIFILGLTVSLAQARRPMPVKVTCPLCGHHFTAIVDVSGTMFGRRLDLKPIGPYPAPWMIPVCPKCHLVIYSRKITAADLARIKTLVKTDGYKALAKDSPTYYLLSRIFRHLNRDALLVAHTLLKATWQVEHQAKKWRQYAAEAVTWFDKGLAKRSPREGRWQVAVMIAGDLERRLGRLAAAKARFEKLRGMKDVPKFQTGILAKIIGYQLELIAKGDTRPHPIPKSFYRKRK